MTLTSKQAIVIDKMLKYLNNDNVLIKTLGEWVVAKGQLAQTYEIEFVLKDQKDKAFITVSSYGISGLNKQLGYSIPIDIPWVFQDLAREYMEAPLPTIIASETAKTNYITLKVRKQKFD